MGDSGNDSGYPYGYHHRKQFNSSRRQKFSHYPHTTTNGYAHEYVEDDDVDGENDDYPYGYQSNEEDANGHFPAMDDEENYERYSKKRKVKTFGMNYESGIRNVNLGTAEWNEHATFVFLDVWGERFLQLGRRSLRSEDWVEVAEKVSEASGVEFAEAQCRNRLDALKKKYKKEKERVEKMRMGSSKWVFFKKMDMLMGTSMRQEAGGLACGVDSGEFVFMNTKVYLNSSNGFDEMRDSPGASEASEEEDAEDGRGLGSGGVDSEAGSSIRLLADSVQKFGEIYEKIEGSKRQQMMELEKMRMDFHMELELQKKQIMERAQAEIAKIRERDSDDSDSSSENLSR